LEPSQVEVLRALTALASLLDEEGRTAETSILEQRIEAMTGPEAEGGPPEGAASNPRE